MNTVTISPKFQVVIPKAVRERLGLEPGEQLCVVVTDGHIRLVPVLEPGRLRGLCKGIDTTIEREEDRL